MIPEQKRKSLLDRYDELEASMAQQGGQSADDFVAMSKEYSELTPVVERMRELDKLHEEIGDLAEMITDPDADAEMKEMAEQEFLELKEQIPVFEKNVMVLLLDADAADDGDAADTANDGDLDDNHDADLSGTA